MLLPTPSTLAAGNTITIHITGTSHPPGFNPVLITVHVDDTIVFLNDAQPSATYSLSADDHSFTSPPILTDQQWSVTFSKPGTHEYHAQNVSQKMVGIIIVAPTSVKLLATPGPAAVASAVAGTQTGHTQTGNKSPPGSGPAQGMILILVMLAIVLLSLGITGSVFLFRRRGPG